MRLGLFRRPETVTTPLKAEGVSEKLTFALVIVDRDNVAALFKLLAGELLDENVSAFIQNSGKNAFTHSEDFAPPYTGQLWHRSTQSLIEDCIAAFLDKSGKVQLVLKDNSPSLESAGQDIIVFSKRRGIIRAAFLTQNPEVKKSFSRHVPRRPLIDRSGYTDPRYIPVGQAAKEMAHFNNHIVGKTCEICAPG